MRGLSFVIGIIGAACGPLPFAIQNPTAGAYAVVLTLSAGASASVAIASFFVREQVQKPT